MIERAIKSISFSEGELKKHNKGHFYYYNEEFLFKISDLAIYYAYKNGMEVSNINEHIVDGLRLVKRCSIVDSNVKNDLKIFFKTTN